MNLLKSIFCSLAIFLFFSNSYAEEENIDSELNQLIQAEEELLHGGDKQQDKQVETLEKEKKEEVPTIDSGEFLSKIEDLESKIKQLEEKNLNLEKDFSRAIQGIKELKAAKEALISDSKVLEDEKAKLIEERSKLQQEIVRLQNELLLRETEIKILSGDPKAKKELEKIRAEKGSQASADKKVPEEVVPDISIVEVIADKVNIRSGAGKRHSPIMQVQKGTRLTVEAQEGSWYRVFTPTGSRGYIKTDVVRKAQAQKPAKQVGQAESSSESGDGGIEARALDRLRANFR